MADKIEIIPNLFEKHIKGSPKNAIVAYRITFLCHLTKVVFKIISKDSNNNQIEPKVYINTKIIKHLYDKKTAEEFDFLINCIHKIVKYPDHIP